MSERAQELAKSLRAFNRGVMAFVDGCAEEQWNKVCAWEQWSVGVTARHIGAGHYTILDLVKKIVAGEKLPEITAAQIVEMANRHAVEHADCKKTEVLEVLEKNGEMLAAYVAGLRDAELDRSSHLALVKGNVTAQQIVEMVVLQSGGEHLANMKIAAGS